MTLGKELVLYLVVAVEPLGSDNYARPCAETGVTGVSTLTRGRPRLHLLLWGLNLQSVITRFLLGLGPLKVSVI